MKYTSLVRAGGIYDLILVAPLAVPGGVPLLLGLLSPVNVALGGEPFPTFAGLSLLFVQLMGSLVSVWSVLRIVRPRWELGLADAAARGLFSLHYGLAIAAGGHPLGWFLLIPEVFWGLVQAGGAAVYRKHEFPTDRKTHP